MAKLREWFHFNLRLRLGAPAARGWIILIFVLIGAGIISNAIQFVRTDTASQRSHQAITRIQRDEQIACGIQKIQLPAGRSLVVALDDIHKLLSIPIPTSERNRQRMLLSPKVFEREQKIIFDLNKQLAAFHNDISQQPASVQCAF